MNRKKRITKSIKETSEIESNNLRDLMSNKLKWAIEERNKGLEEIKRQKTKIQELEKAILRLEGAIMLMQDLLKPQPDTIVKE